jgi:Fungal specific transcription factor domain
MDLIDVRHQPSVTEPEDDTVKQYILRAKSEISSDESSLELVQTHLLLSIAHYSIGDGRNCWRELGTSILLALELELNRESASISSPIDNELRRRTCWACFVFDRYLACGSLRPMLIRDEDINLRLPCPESNFMVGVPDEAPFFSPSTFQSSSSSIGPVSSEMAYINVVSILGRATSYLQTGGIKGDTHFPWHGNSKLATLRSELAVWYSSVLNQFQHLGYEESQKGITLLTMQIYHLIHCLLFREFLPLNYQPENTGGSNAANWQAETVEQCIGHANELVTSLQSNQARGGLIHPFIG